MAFQEASRGKRRLRFRRLVLKSLLVLGLLTGLIVYSARIPDQFVCLQLMTGRGNNSANMALLDLNSGSNMPDLRSSQQVTFGIPSPDGKLRASVQTLRPDDPTRSLVIQQVDETANPTQTVVVQADFAGGGNGFNQFRNIRWSPDSSRLVYFWADADQKTYLSIVNADGSSRHTTEFQMLAASNSRQNTNSGRFGANQLNFGWSSDGRYLSIEEPAATTGTITSLWTTTDLHPVSFKQPITLHTGVWSPKSDQFAALAEDDSANPELALWSPDKEAEIPLDPAGKMADQIVWSPSSQYVALQSHRPCNSNENCTARWSFDVFSSAGTQVLSNLDGSSWNSSSFSVPSGTSAVAAWSADSASWVYLQDEGTSQALVAVHVADSHVTAIASGIVDDLAQDMLYTPSPYYRRFIPGPIRQTTYMPNYSRIVLPTMSNGKITVELADIDGQHRSTLVQGADEIIDPTFMQSGNANHFWPYPGDVVIVVWATTDKNLARTVHLTWAAVDGSGKHDLDEHVDSISYPQVIQANGQKWLGYVAENDGSRSFEIADMNTGKHVRLLDGLKEVSQWSLTSSPQGTQAAIQFGASAYYFYSGGNSLYLVAMDGSWNVNVSEQAVGPVQWSPDGSKLAYLEHDANATVSYAEVVNPKGQEIQNIPVADATSTPPRLYRWSQCT